MEKDAKIGVQRPISIALYANGKSMLRNLDSPVLKAKSKKKYHNTSFVYRKFTLGFFALVKLLEDLLA